MEEKFDGSFTMVQYGRLDMPVEVMRKFNVFLGWGDYKEIKAKFKALPKNKRRFPYVSASKTVVIFPMDATEEEIIKDLEFLIGDLKRRWKVK